MDLKRNPGRVSHLASAAVRVTDCSWRGNLNPSPLLRDEGELLLDEFLSPRKLKDLTGVDDLQQVKALEMRVDTRENSLGSFGVYLPNLRELKLNNSLLVSVRDLGTTLSHLRVLWMARCGLSDLDGISSCSSLRELYIAYNNISDLSQLTWLEHLKVLDLEGNNIEDINQMLYLGLCGKLRRLTVEGNLICLKPSAESAEEPDYNYRAEVKKLIPHLEYLDDIPASQTALPPAKETHEDWLIIKESIKEGGLAGDISWLAGAAARQSGCDPRPPTASRPGAGPCPGSGGRPGRAPLSSGGWPPPGPAAPGELFTEDDSSELTHGLSQVICGNPTKALHARRQKLGPPAACGPRTENLSSGGGGGGGGPGAGPGAGLQQHDELPGQLSRCLQISQQEKATQALKVTPSDEEEGEDCEEGLKETGNKDLTEKTSLDSSYHSCLSQSSSGPSQAQEGAVFSTQDHCFILSPPKKPSPTSTAGVGATPRKPRSYRTRHLKAASQEEDGQQTWPCQPRARQEASGQALGKDLTLPSQHSPGQGQPGPCTAQQVPPSGPGTRPITEKRPPGVTSCPLPAARPPAEAWQGLGLENIAEPLAARATLQPWPARPSAQQHLRAEVPSGRRHLGGSVRWSHVHSTALKD